MTHPIVACARGFIGTRFHHQGRVRKTAAHKGGVDCLGLLIGVAEELQLRGKDGALLAFADQHDYSHQPDTKRLRQQLEEHLSPVEMPALAAGDVVLLRVDDSPQHLAIVSDDKAGLGIIHAYAPAKAVVEHGLDDWWKERIEAVFRVKFLPL